MKGSGKVGAPMSSAMDAKTMKSAQAKAPSTKSTLTDDPVSTYSLRFASYTKKIGQEMASAPSPFVNYDWSTQFGSERYAAYSLTEGCKRVLRHMLWQKIC